MALKLSLAVHQHCNIYAFSFFSCPYLSLCSSLCCFKYLVIITIGMLQYFSVELDLMILINFQFGNGIQNTAFPKKLGRKDDPLLNFHFWFAFSGICMFDYFFDCNLERKKKKKTNRCRFFLIHNRFEAPQTRCIPDIISERIKQTLCSRRKKKRRKIQPKNVIIIFINICLMW